MGDEDVKEHASSNQLELRDRETMGHWASKKVEKNELHAYQAEWNASSLDGLTGLRVARRDAGERLWVTGSRVYLTRIVKQREALCWGIGIGILMMWVFLGGNCERQGILAVR